MQAARAKPAARALEPARNTHKVATGAYTDTGGGPHNPSALAGACSNENTAAQLLLLLPLVRVRVRVRLKGRATCACVQRVRVRVRLGRACVRACVQRVPSNADQCPSWGRPYIRPQVASEKSMPNARGQQSRDS